MAGMSTTPKRRWLVFSLRTMFVVLTLGAALAAGVGYPLKWIAERHRFLNGVAWGIEASGDTKPPMSLRPFSEAAISIIWDVDLAKCKEARRLFPEATIVYGNRNGWHRGWGLPCWEPGQAVDENAVQYAGKPKPMLLDGYPGKYPGLGCQILLRNPISD